MVTYWQEEEIEPEGHAQVGLVCEWQGSVADTLQVGQGILENTEVGSNGSGKGRLEQASSHQPYMGLNTEVR